MNDLQTMADAMPIQHLHLESFVDEIGGHRGFGLDPYAEESKGATPWADAELHQIVTELVQETLSL